MKRYNKDGFHAEHDEGVFVLYEDAKREIDELKDALKRISNYTAHGDYSEEDRKLLTERNRLAEDIKNCAECSRARETSWPPSGLCPTHYRAFARTEVAIAKMHEHKETYEPRNIAREALYKLEKM